MPLSEEDYATISRRAHLAGTGDVGMMDAAYALGVERARVVKPLEWIELREDWVWIAKDAPYHVYKRKDGYGYEAYTYTRLCGTEFKVIDTKNTLLHEAKAACDEHHAARVLVLLVAP